MGQPRGPWELPSGPSFSSFPHCPRHVGDLPTCGSSLACFATPGRRSTIVPRMRFILVLGACVDVPAIDHLNSPPNSVIPGVPSRTTALTNTRAKSPHTCKACATMEVRYDPLGSLFTRLTPRGEKKVFSIPPLANDSYSYVGPTGSGDAADLCKCNTVVYSLMSACDACQGANWFSYVRFPPLSSLCGLY